MNIFDKYYKLKVSEMAATNDTLSDKTLISTPTTAKSSLVDSQEFEKSVLELPEEVFAKLTVELKFKHEPRNIIQ